MAQPPSVQDHAFHDFCIFSFLKYCATVEGIDDLWPLGERQLDVALASSVQNMDFSGRGTLKTTVCNASRHLRMQQVVKPIEHSNK